MGVSNLPDLTVPDFGQPCGHVGGSCLCFNPRPRSQQTDSPPMTIQAFSPTLIEIFSRDDLAWSYVTQNVTKQVSLIRWSESLIS